MHFRGLALEHVQSSTLNITCLITSMTLQRNKFVYCLGRDESERRRAESQWIMAARPLYHLQYPIAYLSRLQRILPIAQWELRYKAAVETHPSQGLRQRHVPLGAKRPLLLVRNQAMGACIASSPNSDLEVFSHNPTHVASHHWLFNQAR